MTWVEAWNGLQTTLTVKVGGHMVSDIRTMVTLFERMDTLLNTTTTTLRKHFTSDLETLQTTTSYLRKEVPDATTTSTTLLVTVAGLRAEIVALKATPPLPTRESTSTGPPPPSGPAPPPLAASPTWAKVVRRARKPAATPLTNVQRVAMSSRGYDPKAAKPFRVQTLGEVEAAGSKPATPPASPPTTSLSSR